MLQSQVIAFLGTVGSGKSTHMKLLYSKLKQRGLKTKISCLKTGHLFAFILEVSLARMVADKRKDVFPIRALVEEKPCLFRKIFKLWLSLDLISITVKFLAGVYFPLRLGYTVLVEEYIPATISDYIYLSKIIDFPLKVNSFAINYLLRLMSLCSPTQMIFLDAKNDELKTRWKLRRSFSERDDYLQMQRTLLLQLSRKLSPHKFIYVDTGARMLSETQELIMRHLLV
jgi:thymidylate kinase